VARFLPQLHRQPGRDWSKIDRGNVGWSAVTGGAAGLLLISPFGTTVAGVATIRAMTNFLNYGNSTLDTANTPPPRTPNGSSNFGGSFNGMLNYGPPSPPSTARGK
jgi:hypothetical protein